MADKVKEPTAASSGPRLQRAAHGAPAPVGMGEMSTEYELNIIRDRVQRNCEKVLNEKEQENLRHLEAETAKEIEELETKVRRMKEEKNKEKGGITQKEIGEYRKEQKKRILQRYEEKLKNDVTSTERKVMEGLGVAAACAAGATTGGMCGALLGPPGIAVGAAAGAAVGAAAGALMGLFTISKQREKRLAELRAPRPPSMGGSQ